ncbi:Crp/Fnr family transcriptional regulator [Natranaerofaba carboxydovora]|uniref:Crp/Fnr family transcriptional regulator n=1 Tax=Natranaerofaba carboxydovora TaxID=2742683 RepID=UPI001F130B32|nr:Crp/Fnr family transcriptional regulator [Natranaerofaba carboxydovora]UMZ74763.1 Global nitrogen regulator [Natranaerofaba carboxydovora]
MENNVTTMCMTSLPLFEGLSAKEKNVIRQLAEKKYLKKGEVLFYQDENADALYLIKKGRLKLSRIFPDGREIAIGFTGTDEVLGQDALFRDNSQVATATAVEDAFVCYCTKEQFERAVQKSPQLAMKIIANLGKKLHETTSWVSSLAAGDVKYRLVSLLERLSEEYGRYEGDRLKLDVKLTHQELADFIGSSRVMVTNILKQLPGVEAKGGIIWIEDPSVLTCELDGLEEMVE